MFPLIPFIFAVVSDFTIMSSSEKGSRLRVDETRRVNEIMRAIHSEAIKGKKRLMNG